MNSLQDAIDIVIPVYNGFEDIQLCMDSIRRHTDLKKHYVLLINDCSPDERVRPYLDSQAEEHIIVMHNEKNQGFSANVNKGMLYSRRDVILLNSDTIVTRNWVEKIKRCAYASSENGTVTPLSNSATLCSVPVVCQDNPLPENVTVDEYGEIIEKHSLHRYPQITVAVGFCMYIKQVVIEEVGLFDAETFQRGYGEENDFCNRASLLGYRHVMCDDTFIYHKGTASFDTEEKLALSQAHDKILNERYPVQMRKNHLYCMENPDQEIRDNIEIYTKLYTGRKNILYLLHLDFQEDSFNNIGGIQLHVKDLMKKLRKQYNVFVAARDRNYLRVTAYTGDKTLKFKFDIGEEPEHQSFRDSRLRKIYDEILDAFQIDLVHVHHTQSLSLEAFYAAKERKLPLYVTIHDYYYMCPTIKLLTEKNEVCTCCGQQDRTEAQEERCRACLSAQCGIAPQVGGYLDKWRKENREALSLCDKVIYPSEVSKDIFLSCYPELREKSMVITHGADELRQVFQQVDKPAKVKITGKVRTHLDIAMGSGKGLNDVRGWAFLRGADSRKVTVIAGIQDANGKEVFYKTQQEARTDVAALEGDPGAVWCGFLLRSVIPEIQPGNCKIHIYLQQEGEFFTDGKSYKAFYRGKTAKDGRLNVGFLGGMVPAKGSELAKKMIAAEKERINWFVFGAVGDAELWQMEQDNLFFSDVYRKENIFHMLRENQIDVVCILPAWAETFCYTVSEAWLCEIPVLGTDIGAVGERIRETGGGWVVPHDAPADVVLDKLLCLEKNREEIKDKAEIVRQIHLKSIPEMADDYIRLYQSEFESSEPGKWEKADYEFIFQGYALANEQVAGSGYYGALNKLRKENEMLKGNMNMLQGTISYRMARKISNANIPFKEQLKKWLRR